MPTAFIIKPTDEFLAQFKNWAIENELQRSFYGDYSFKFRTYFPEDPLDDAFRVLELTVFEDSLCVDFKLRFMGQIMHELEADLENLM